MRLCDPYRGFEVKRPHGVWDNEPGDDVLAVDSRYYEHPPLKKSDGVPKSCVSDFEAHQIIADLVNGRLGPRFRETTMVIVNSGRGPCGRFSSWWGAWLLARRGRLGHGVRSRVPQHAP